MRLHYKSVNISRKKYTQYIKIKYRKYSTMRPCVVFYMIRYHMISHIACIGDGSTDFSTLNNLKF